MSMNVCVLLGSQHKLKTANAHYRCYIYKYIIPFSYKATGLYGNCMHDIIYRLACMCYMQYRARAEGGAGGALAPPLFYSKKKNNKNLSK